MKQTAFLIITASLLITACQSPKQPSLPDTVSQDSLVKRGAYLATLAGCGDCHSPKVMTPMGPQPDTARLFSGHRSNVPAPPIEQDVFEKGWVLYYMENTALAAPGFVSFAANISADSSGIGTWTFDQFKVAMTKGKYKGLPNGRDLLPPMPWPNYSSMTEEDLSAIFSFLKSTKPVHNIVPQPVLVKGF